MNLQFVTIPTFIIQCIILGIIFWVLNKFIFQPYIKYLDEMEEKQKKVESDYKNIEWLISKAEVQKEEILWNARKTGEAIVSESETIGKKKREDIIAKAELDGKDLLNSGRSEIEKERLAAMSSVKSHLVDLILKLNEKLFKDSNITKDYIEKELLSMK